MKQPGSRRFLLEVGTEEIPDRFLARAQDDLRRGLAQALKPLGILEGDLNWSAWSTPRRLAVAVEPVRARQEDREEEVVGPAVRVAFDGEGRATRAAEGFARSQGVNVDEMRRVQTPKGEYVAVRRKVQGRPARELLAETCGEVLRRMRFGKTMRWGDVGFRFVRPVRWIVALLDDQVVPFELAGVKAGRSSRGLRHAQPQEIPLASAGDYADALRQAQVFVDPGERRETIRAGLERAAAEVGGDLLADDALVEILVHMTEDPSVIHGSFPDEYLELPREVLVTAMRHHQRYFSVLDPTSSGDGKLLPVFLAVLNRQGDPDGTIRRGNEWVLRARLADARFFWQEDRKRTLESRSGDLERVIFQEKLGSYHEKVARVESLARTLGEWLELPGPVVKAACRAAQLAKCDLPTEMVGEFPELQGVIGGIYAAEDGEPAAVSMAIYDHYRPAGAGEALPRETEGLLVALADRLDTLAGYFSLGLEPTGTRDPYALRRAALAMVRILTERPWFLSLGHAVQRALELYPASERPSADAGPRLRSFLLDRVRHLAQTTGHRYDSVSAVLAVQHDDIRDASLRLDALTTLRADTRHEEDFLSLSSAFKRIRNLVKDQEEGSLDPAALVEPPEVDLHRALGDVEQGLEETLRARDYLETLRSIAGLRPSVDAFLGSSRSEGVLVLAKEPGLRRNRLALLRRAGSLFTRVADFSEIVVEGEASRAPS